MFTLMQNHFKHFYTSRKKRVNLIVLHVTAGLEDLDMLGIDHSAEATNRYGATTSREVSWHKVVDSDSIADALPDEYTAFHVRGYNGQSLGLEVANSDARWDNKPKTWVEATIRNMAIVCHAWEQKFGIPRVLLNKSQVDAGHSGYSYHMFLDPTRRTDPGRTFPWGLFVQYLSELDRGHVPPPPPHIPTTTPDGGLVFRTVKRGSTGQDVRNLQGLLLAAGRTVAVDGDFGRGTEQALKNWQSAVGLPANGVADTIVFRRLLGV